MILKKLQEIKELRLLHDNSKNVYEERHKKETKKSNYDKTCFGFATKPGAHNLHEVIYFQNYSGVYGDSNVSSDFREELTPFIVKAINERKEEIFYRALELITKETQSQISELEKETEEATMLINEIKQIKA